MYDNVVDPENVSIVHGYEDLRRKIDYKQLEHMYTRGDRTKDIAYHFGCTVRGVIKAVVKLGLKRRPPHRPKVSKSHDA